DLRDAPLDRRDDVLLGEAVVLPLGGAAQPALRPAHGALARARGRLLPGPRVAPPGPIRGRPAVAGAAGARRRGRSPRVPPPPTGGARWRRGRRGPRGRRAGVRAAAGPADGPRGGRRQGARRGVADARGARAPRARVPHEPAEPLPESRRLPAPPAAGPRRA